MNILWASPLPPIRSGVSDYAVELLEELGGRAKVRVVRPPGWSEPKYWPLEKTVELVATDTEPQPDEVSLVHLGNNPHHLWLLGRLEHPRTVVVLHDLILHHLLVEATATDGRFGRLGERLREAHGDSGVALAGAREVGLSGRRDAFLFAARSPFIEKAEAVVVHSRWGEEAVLAENPDLPVGRIGLPVADPGWVDRTVIREELGMGNHEVVLMHLGFLTPEKGLEGILGGVAAASRLRVPVRLVVVGEGSVGNELMQAAGAVGIADRVEATGWLSPERFPSIPAAADLGVVLRTPSAGETSAAALRFLACGTPVAVGGRHQFLEIPEAAAPRLTPGPSVAAELARLLVAVGQDGPDWGLRRRAARETYEAGHTPSQTAEQLLDFLATVF